MANHPNRSMVRKITIWHVWDGSDAAQSDSFFPTKDAALRHIKENYDGVKLSDEADGRWMGYSQLRHETDGLLHDSDDVHLEMCEVEVTREGICRALHLIPNR